METIEGGKLLKGGNYLRKYDTYILYMAWLDQGEMMAWLGSGREYLTVLSGSGIKGDSPIIYWL